MSSGCYLEPESLLPIQKPPSHISLVPKVLHMNTEPEFLLSKKFPLGQSLILCRDIALNNLFFYCCVSFPHISDYFCLSLRKNFPINLVISLRFQVFFYFLQDCFMFQDFFFSFLGLSLSCQCFSFSLVFSFFCCYLSVIYTL